jgi:hypothetical protein
MTIPVEGQEVGLVQGPFLKSVKLTEFSGMPVTLWIRRVLVRSQEGQLGKLFIE